MSLLTATLAQIGLPEWVYAADTEKKRKSGGYYSGNSRAARAENRAKAIALLKECGPLFPDDIATRLLVPPKTAQAICGGLAKSKLAERTPNGAYRLK